MTNSEARFTQASDECPTPEYWTSEDVASTENEVLEMLYGIVRGLQPDFVIETGSAFGFGTKKIGLALKKNGHGTLVSMEINPDRVKEATKKVAGLPVSILDCSSLDYTPDRPIDFAFFDSEFDLRAKEFEHYYPFMTHRTIVAFHDTGPQHPLRPDIDDLARRNLITSIYLPTPRGIALARVLK